MDGHVRCPKCGSARAWIEKDHGGLMQRCLCGLARPVVKKAEGNITILSAVVRPSDAVLPQTGTKTRRCLMAVFRAWPQEINTSEVAESASLENKETSALLMTLMARALVERLAERRGLRGGSSWKLTPVAHELLKP